MSTLYPDLPLINFPDNMDSFLNYLNITATDAPLIRQYFQAIQDGDMATAQSVYNQIPQNSQKILTAQGLNKMNQAISALQRFYKTDVKDYIEEKQREFNAQVDKFFYRGEWSASEQYFTTNYVQYTVGSNNYVYIAINNPPIGTFPTNPDYWRVMTVRGLQGTSGDCLAFNGEWNSQQNYTTDDIVTFNNTLWGATQSSINETPYEGSNYWQFIYRGTPTVYPVSTSRPPIQQDGALWFQIIESEALR